MAEVFVLEFIGLSDELLFAVGLTALMRKNQMMPRVAIRVMIVEA